MKLGALFHFIDMRSPSFFLLDFARRISFVGWQPEWMPWAKAIIRKYLRWWRKWVLCFNLAARSIAAGHQAEQKKKHQKKTASWKWMCDVCSNNPHWTRENAANCRSHLYGDNEMFIINMNSIRSCMFMRRRTPRTDTNDIVSMGCVTVWSVSVCG